MSGELHEVSHAIGRIEAKLDSLNNTVSATIKEHANDITELKDEMNKRKGAWAALCAVGSFFGVIIFKGIELVFK